jgi:hypothetical protein
MTTSRSALSLLEGAGMQGGDRFEIDCVRHHAVLVVPKVSDGVSKASNLRAFAG